MGQSICSASDLFTIITDSQIKLDKEWKIFKNMDDVLLWGNDIQDLEKQLVTFLDLCTV